jgi:prevent-host-death family protein
MKATESQTSDITLRDLRNDTSRVLRRAEAGERIRVLVNRRPVAEIGPLEDRETWVPSEIAEQRIRGAQADPGLRDELARLLPDTVEEL